VRLGHRRRRPRLFRLREHRRLVRKWDDLVRGAYRRRQPDGERRRDDHRRIEFDGLARSRKRQQLGRR
jgi:hypothetical protein